VDQEVLNPINQRRKIKGDKIVEPRVKIQDKLEDLFLGPQIIRDLLDHRDRVLLGPVTIQDLRGLAETIQVPMDHKDLVLLDLVLLDLVLLDLVLLDLVLLDLVLLDPGIIQDPDLLVVQEAVAVDREVDREAEKEPRRIKRNLMLKK
jgi:hypothetical protein